MCRPWRRSMGVAAPFAPVIAGAFLVRHVAARRLTSELYVDAYLQDRDASRAVKRFTDILKFRRDSIGSSVPADMAGRQRTVPDTGGLSGAAGRMSCDGSPRR